MILQRELNKPGVTLDDNRTIIPSSELPMIAERLGLKFYSPGDSYSLKSDTPVVAIIHEPDVDENIDAIAFGAINDFVGEKISGLFVRKEDDSE